MPKIKTGEFEVLHSGIFHAIENERNVISLGGVDLVLLFETKEGAETSVEFAAKGGKSAEIRLINVDTSLGYGTTQPFQIGEAFGKKLFFTFVTRSLKDRHLRSFEYTFYTK